MYVCMYVYVCMNVCVYTCIYVCKVRLGSKHYRYFRVVTWLKCQI